MIENSKFKNRLIYEKSPYLIQHAQNPVDWYPWGKEAFQKAKEENKLIFLSIGYSTCHWCHVMAHESFEDDEVAEVLKRNFVAVKVDKEERPDIDAVYMEVCQMLTGHGGWPLTILMTPEQKPVFAGTYFPKHRKYGQIGLVELLEAFAEAWQKNPQELVQESEKVTAFLYKDEHRKKEYTEISKEIFRKAAGQYAQNYDEKYGGFGTAPKFPAAHNLLFLLRYAQFGNDGNLAKMAYNTLLAMYRGGIFDHIGGGFSRYSVDGKWLVPHFEKMLYDNALLAYVYMEAYQMSGDMIFCQIAEKVFRYVLRELTHSGGGFYCGQDADSEGEEGKYYVFDKDEIIEELGEEKGRKYCEWYGISEDGNFEGKNILNLIENKDFANPDLQIEGMNRQMEEYRGKRMKLHRDDKILTSWNGLMIAAFAKGYQVTQNEGYLNAAKRAEHFITRELTKQDGRLGIRWREGEVAGKGQLSDYAFMSWAELELYRATFDVDYLEKAVELAKWMGELFYDKENGGYFLYGTDAERLIYRPKEVYDGAIPSGNGMAAYVLVEISHLTGELIWSERAERQLKFMAGNASAYPMGCSQTLLAMLGEIFAYRELVITAEEMEDFKAVKAMLRERWNGNLGMIGKTPENADRLAQLCPYTKDYPIEKDGASYFLCQDGACLPKVKRKEQLKEILEKE